MIPNIGELFRQFRVLEKVGEGGMGEVYRAHDTRLDRDVALKFLTRLGRVSSEYGERLRREARSLAAVSHANIVTIYDIDEVDGVPFLVLEWIPGKALSHPSHRKPFGEDAFLQMTLPVAEALAAAHERGIVHRDVKPGNVLVTDKGHVKLVDFGLAKVPEGDANLTRESTLVGTMAYLSPEQAKGEEVGPASDIFSFGVMGYELLTGQVPFWREGASAILYAIVHEAHVPLSKQRRDLPGALVELVERCLRKEPAARFRDGAELAQELRRALRGNSSAEGRDLASSDQGVRGGAASTPDIRFCTTADGARIAYSLFGTGPLLVRVLGWFTHLEMEWEWPALRLLWERLGERYAVLRYDGRGIGLSDPWSGDFTEETRQLDLEAVLNAIPMRNAILFGISEGGWSAALYATSHPERIRHLILYGAYSRGASARPGYDLEEEEALMVLIRKGWGRDTPGFRQIFTSKYFGSDAEPGLVAHFNEMQRASADGETAARYEKSLHERGDGRDIFVQVRTPTLVIHCRDDQVIGFEEGRRLAALIPGAQFFPLPSGTHYFPTSQEVTKKLVDAIIRFTG